MKEKLLELIEMNRARGWFIVDMLKKLRLSPSTYSRIMKIDNYAEKIMNVKKSIKLKEKGNALLLEEIT